MSCIEAHYVPYESQQRVGRGRVLVFAPHPDDEVLGCCGAIIQHIEDGDPVRVVVLTDGGFSLGEDQTSYIERRKQESLAAATYLGYEDVQFWGMPDRGLIANSELIERVGDEMDRMEAEWVYAPSWWEIHPDHTATSEAVTQAASKRPGLLKLVLYEVGVPLQPNLLIDITNVVERKKKAISMFQSQLEIQEYDRHVLSLNVFRTYTLPPSVMAAEAYRVIDRVEAIERQEPCPLMLPRV